MKPIREAIATAEGKEGGAMTAHPGCTLLRCTDYKDGICQYDLRVCKYRHDESAEINRELLEACKSLMDALGGPGCDCGGSSMCVLCNAVKAISKAEGKE